MLRFFRWLGRLINSYFERQAQNFDEFLKEMPPEQRSEFLNELFGEYFHKDF